MGIVILYVAVEQTLKVNVNRMFTYHITKDKVIEKKSVQASNTSSRIFIHEETEKENHANTHQVTYARL
jgi:hypothetical protein